MSPSARLALFASSLAAAAVLQARTAAADERDSREEPPVLAGPVLLGPARAEVRAASIRVVFGESGHTARIDYVLSIVGLDEGEAVVGLAGRGVRSFEASADGSPLAVEPSAVPLPLAGAPFDRQVTIRIAVSPALTTTVVVGARCDTAEVERHPRLVHAQATFILNRLLEGPRGRTVSILPGPALAEVRDLAMRVETPFAFWPEAPVAGAGFEIETGEAVEGPVVSDPAAPIEVAALQGDYEAPRSWGIAFGMGLALDWQRRIDGVVVDPATDTVTGAVYSTAPWDDPTTRIWFRALFEYSFGPWLLAAGVEGDPGGALEIPITAVWFPQPDAPSWDDVFADYRLFAGLSLQLINDPSAGERGFDPRVFVRLGGGVRLLMLTAELAYEIAPPLGSWDGERGGLEHKLLITFPWVF